uniref:ADP-ribosyl cyclase/cyclic ADP-ribose hydrolase n=1 Tax=Salarias fasciatus TaxID=181472 RepID=A0A672J713_SALFA
AVHFHLQLLIFAGFIMLQLCPCQTRGQHGTTPHIKHIVMGRCYSYSALVNPGLSYDCEEIWRRFEEAVVHPTTCNVSVQDYHPMFNLMPQIWPCDKVSSFHFSSLKHRVVSQSVLRHFWTLEDTLPGYMFNDLIWCGRDTESGTKAGKKLPKCKYTQSSGKIRVASRLESSFIKQWRSALSECFPGLPSETQYANICFILKSRVHIISGWGFPAVLPDVSRKGNFVSHH